MEEKLNQIIDNIAMMKHGLIHSSMLTATEILTTKLDFYKLKNVRTGLLKYKENTIILALKIPNSYKIEEYKLITSLPTTNNLQAMLEDQYFIEINGTKYVYDENLNYERELKPLSKSITRNNCVLVENNGTEIVKVDDNTIICKNLKQTNIVNYCDDRNIHLNGNYLININNCTIQILNQTFGKTNVKFIDRFFYNENTDYNFTKNIDFKEIVLENKRNLEHINILKFHKNINYLSGSIVSAFLLILFIIILTLYHGHKKIENCCKKLAIQ